MSNMSDGTVAGPLAEPRVVPEIGYRIEPFLNEADIAAVYELYRETTSQDLPDHYNTALGTDKAAKYRVLNFVKELLSDKVADLVPGCSIFSASFVFKKATGGKLGKLGLHPDPTTVNPHESIGINLWAPLCDVHERNGCMQVVDYSSRFGHIAAVPHRNPAPFSKLYRELETDYVKPVNMKAGEALIFDTRMLHTTQPNITDQDRITLFINLVPTGTEPRLFFWNPENPLQLEAYDVDCEFIFDLDATQYPDEAQRAKGKFVERIDYNPVLWTKEDLQQRIPELSRNARAVAADSVSKPVVSAPVPVPVPAPVPARPVPAVVSPAPIGFLQRLSKIFSVG